jgi:HSP20 family protein
MAIERWDPYREAVSLRDAMNSLFQESFIRPGSMLAEDSRGMIPLDVSENENEYVIKASMPGVKPEDVKVSVHGETLTIRGETKAQEEKKGETWHLRERRFGSYHRSVTLPAPVDASRAEARSDHGVLTLTLPKAEQAQPKQIKVSSGAGSSR